MTRRRTFIRTACMTLAMTSGSAHAAASLRDAVFRTPPVSSQPIPTPLQTPSPFPPGIARTSIDHRFDGKPLDGSLGFLCGIQPKAVTDGAAGAYGVDPQGRFLGLKLRMTFR